MIDLGDINMTYDEEMELSKTFYDTIDFTKFFDFANDSIMLDILIIEIENYYDNNHPELLSEEFQDCFLNFMNNDEFADYLCERYGYKKHIEEPIEHIWIYIHPDIVSKKFKEELKKIKEARNKQSTSINRMGCSESWYDPYYAIAHTFDDETLATMSEHELYHLIELANKMSEAFY